MVEKKWEHINAPFVYSISWKIFIIGGKPTAKNKLIMIKLTQYKLTD